MKIEERTIGDVHMISVRGRMDTVSSKDVEASLSRAAEDGRKRIVVNMSDVDYISSMGLRVLVAAYKRQKKEHGSLELVSLQPHVQNIFKIAGLDRVFPIYTSEEGAVQSSKSASF
jgi:anti-sigma B factor antagonist